MIIGVAGVARSGKNTLASILGGYIKNPVELSLAWQVKENLRNFIINEFMIDSHTEVDKEKNLIRPLLVAYANAKRQESRGTYWTGILDKKVNAAIKSGEVPVITDCRFNFYEEDEAWWIQKKHRGILIHVERWDENGNKILPANQSEMENDQLIKDAADYRVNWPTNLNFEELKQYIPADVIERLKTL